VDLRSRCALNTRIAREDGYTSSVMVEQRTTVLFIFSDLIAVPCYHLASSCPKIRSFNHQKHRLTCGPNPRCLSMLSSSIDLPEVIDEVMTNGYKS
jgi:hypothetical protein